MRWAISAAVGALVASSPALSSAQETAIATGARRTGAVAGFRLGCTFWAGFFGSVFAFAARGDFAAGAFAALAGFFA